MQLNIYRRAEHGKQFSYLAVPVGSPIPEEATNTDWEIEAENLQLEEGSGDMSRYAIKAPLEQISAKGYAITALDRNDHPSP